MKKTYIAPAEKIAELDLQDGILTPTSDLGIMTTSLEDEDEQLVKDDKAFGNLWDNIW